MIEINGAGPAGLAAAIDIANSDYEVCVYEKQKEVGSRFAGSYQFMFIPGSNTDARFFLRTFLPNPILKKMFLVPIHTIKISTMSKTIEFYSIKPVFWTIKRGSSNDALDTALLNTAKSKGVKVKFGSTCDSPLIDATGGKIPKGIAREFIFDTDIDDVFHIIMDKRLAPGGYAYLCVINKKATLCVAVTKQMEKIVDYANECLQVFKEVYGLEMKNIHVQTNYVSFEIKDSYIDDSVCVGECAGLQDGLFGFGMWYAITSGQLAAQSLINDFDYDKSAKALFLPLLKTGRVNRYFYEFFETFFGNVFYNVLLDFSKRKKIKNLFKQLTEPSLIKLWIYDFIGD